MDKQPTPIPRTHPALVPIVSTLLVIIVVCAAIVFWPRPAVSPESSPTPVGVGAGEHCGGNIVNAPVCQGGYHCAKAPGSNLPVGDVGGVCVADVTYRNDTYGLLVKLPDDWRGYSVSIRQLQATDVASGNPISDFPEVVLRHPLWSQSKPYEDLPLMVFTPEQWSHVGMQGENEWSVSAAPIPPSELARNGKYIIALPARYNYDFAEGFQELDDALRAGAVSAFEPAR